MKIYDVIILGAGASGLMCAGNISKKKSVAIFDANAKAARKVKISGGGKCNITNNFVSSKNYEGNEKFIENIFKIFSKEDLLRYLQRNHIALELRKNRYYFCQNSSQDIIDTLLKDAKHAELFYNHKIVSLAEEAEQFVLRTNRGEYRAKKVVVATGGKSFQNLGASDIGLEIAKSFGLQVQEFTPALVGLTVQKEQFWMKELSGLSCFVHIKVAEKILQEEMLFAHKGISGPAVLSASLYWKKGPVSIDFLPGKNIVDLAQGKKLVISAIPLPKRLAKALLRALGVADKECNKLSHSEKEKLKKIHNYTFSPAGNFGFSKAEVSRGGVMVRELDENTLEARNIKNLYFIGEVVDVTGELGGYNFQWAFSSGYVCSKAL